MSRPPAREIWRFASRALLWMVPAFAAWYAVAPMLARPAGWLARLIVDAGSRGIVTALEWHGRMLTIVTDVTVPLESGARGVLAPEIDPLVYTYGAALFAALALASRLRTWRVAAGVALLVPFQAWGIAFEVLAEVGVKVPLDVARGAGIAGTWRELVPLGFQLGSLIFPTLAPIVAWAALGGLAALLPGTAKEEQAAA